MDSLAHWRNSESKATSKCLKHQRDKYQLLCPRYLSDLHMKNAINWGTLYLSLRFNWHWTSILVQLNHAIYPGFQFFLLTEVNFRVSTLTTHVLPLKGYQILCHQTHRFGKWCRIHKWCIWQLVFVPLESQKNSFT